MKDELKGLEKKTKKAVQNLLETPQVRHWYYNERGNIEIVLFSPKN